MRPTRSIVALLIAAALAWGCTWSQMAGGPADAVSRARPDRVRVTMVGGRELVLDRPLVSHDSLISMGASGVEGVPLDSIARLEQRTADGARIAGILIGAAAGSLTFVLTR